MLHVRFADCQFDVVIKHESLAARCPYTKQCSAKQCKAQSASEPTRYNRMLDVLFLAHLFCQALQNEVALRSHASCAGEDEWVEIAMLYLADAFAVFADL